MLGHVKKFFELVGAYGTSIIKADGFFFVALTILNAPIYFFGGNIRTSVYLFWLGAFVIFVVTAAMHSLPLKVRRLLQTALIIAFAVLFVANIFLVYKFGVPLNLDMLQIVLATNPIETKEFFQTYFTDAKTIGGVMVFVFALTALNFGLKKFFATCSPERLKKFFIELLIIFAMPFIIYIYIIFGIRNNLPQYMLNNTTLGLTVRIVVTLAETMPMGNDSKIFATMDKQLDTEKILSDSSDIPWVIFLLGESTDRNHMQLYGYRLPTTPHLTARFERGEIFRFNDTIACANNTAPAMSKIFTFAEKDEPKDDWFLKSNIFDIVRRAGYHTVWLSNQAPKGLWGSLDRYFSARCDEKFFVEPEEEFSKQQKIDGELLPIIDKFLAASTVEKNFYVIHLYGTHGLYKDRYPAEFEKFSAADEDKPEESWRQGTAEYDNAVLYNDFIVDEIIRRFENKNAVLIYISDHGEEVYDGRDFAWHSVEAVGNVHMIEIPALVWASTKFRERYPEKISALKAAVDRPYRTDYMIHALLELMDIRTASFDATKSIINENFNASLPRLYNGKPYSK